MNQKTPQQTRPGQTDPRGYIGETVDTTPRSSFTLAGVTGRPKPADQKG